MEETAKLIINSNINTEDITLKNIIDILKAVLKLNDKSSLKAAIEMYNKYIISIWKEKMTNSRNYKEGEPFKFIVHNLTKDDFYDEFATELVSASLITDKSMGLCGSKKIGFVLVPSNFVSAVPYDLYTKNDYYKKSFNYKDYDNRNYEKVFNHPHAILHPEIIENEIVEKTILENGEILNNDRKKVFSEIVVDNWFPNAIYTITNGEKEISSNYRRAKKLNEVYMFDFIDIDKSVYRMKNNLEPLTINEQKELALDLFQVTNTSKEKLEELYKKIYELFLHLKRNNIYTPDLFINEFQKIKK